MAFEIAQPGDLAQSPVVETTKPRSGSWVLA
jgi:hypothetical protein